ncbi:hypothetical protein GMB34_11705 [Turicibacter sanguinis]|nr:hypothetical protein [Turicibacter sanguinis]MTN84858.1 hypothetical protein [Turicibacter sanguinis]MTN87680.1 hypothetical protein [Turicibacter sanguinis]MTN90502.1 hypothetical protein [Turicibacter sanguinis]MTN93424.1 hypothetical protein [Turicibacter sanguinis]
MSNEIKANLTSETNLNGQVSANSELNGTVSSDGNLTSELVSEVNLNGKLGLEVYVQGAKINCEEQYQGYLNSFVGEKGDKGEQGIPGRDLLEIYKEISGNMDASEEDLLNYMMEYSRKYIRTTPVINSVGGVPAGKVFDNHTLASVLDELFFANQTEEQISYIVYYGTVTLDDIQNKNFEKSDFKKIFTDRRTCSLVFEEQGDEYYSLMIFPKELFEHNLPRLSVGGFEGGFCAENITFNGETVVAWRTNQNVTGITVDVR